MGFHQAEEQGDLCKPKIVFFFFFDWLLNFWWVMIVQDNNGISYPIRLILGSFCSYLLIVLYIFQKSRKGAWQVELRCSRDQGARILAIFRPEYASCATIAPLLVGRKVVILQVCWAFGLRDARHPEVFWCDLRKSSSSEVSVTRAHRCSLKRTLFF